MKGYILKKPFKCKFCDYCSNRKEYVNSHERTHTGEKPFACDICEQKFNHKSTLGIHILSHTGEKPFSCTICDTKFRQRPHLKSHMKLVHSGPEKKVFSCTICQKTFTTKDSLVKHQALHSTEKNFLIVVFAQNLLNQNSTNLIELSKMKSFAAYALTPSQKLPLRNTKRKFIIT